MTRLLFTASCMLAIISCNQPAEFSEKEKKEVMENVSQTLKNYYTDIKKAGLKAEFKYLDNSAEFFWVPPGYTSSIGYDSVAFILNKNADGYRSIDNSFETLKVIPLSKELASYTGKVHSTMTDTSGKTITISLIETAVMIKRVDGWKLLNGQTSILEH